MTLSISSTHPVSKHAIIVMCNYLNSITKYFPMSHIPPPGYHFPYFAKPPLSILSNPSNPLRNAYPLSPTNPTSKTLPSSSPHTPHTPNPPPSSSLLPSLLPPHHRIIITRPISQRATIRLARAPMPPRLAVVVGSSRPEKEGLDGELECVVDEEDGVFFRSVLAQCLGALRGLAGHWDEGCAGGGGGEEDGVLFLLVRGWIGLVEGVFFLTVRHGRGCTWRWCGRGRWCRGRLGADG